MFKTGLYSRREWSILGASHIVVEKGGGISWERGVDSGSVANSCGKEEGLYSEREGRF